MSFEASPGLNPAAVERRSLAWSSNVPSPKRVSNPASLDPGVGNRPTHLPRANGSPTASLVYHARSHTEGSLIADIHPSAAL